MHLYLKLTETLKSKRIRILTNVSTKCGSFYYVLFSCHAIYNVNKTISINYMKYLNPGTFPTQNKQFKKLRAYLLLHTHTMTFRNTQTHADAHTHTCNRKSYLCPINPNWIVVGCAASGDRLNVDCKQWRIRAQSTIHTHTHTFSIPLIFSWHESKRKDTHAVTLYAKRFFFLSLLFHNFITIIWPVVINS